MGQWAWLVHYLAGQLVAVVSTHPVSLHRMYAKHKTAVLCVVVPEPAGVVVVWRGRPFHPGPTGRWTEVRGRCGVIPTAAAGSSLERGKITPAWSTHSRYSPGGRWTVQRYIAQLSTGRSGRG